MRVLISFIIGVAIVACLLAGSSATFSGRSDLERCLEDWPSAFASRSSCSHKMKCFKRYSWLNDFNLQDPCISSCFYGKCCGRRRKCSVHGHFKALRKCICKCDDEHVRYVYITDKPAAATTSTMRQTEQAVTTSTTQQIYTEQAAITSTMQQNTEPAATTLPLTTLPPATEEVTTTIEMTTPEDIEVPTQLPV